MDINQFKKELKELLKKYDASISFECSESSDTYALYGEKMVIHRNDYDENYTICEGRGFDQSDISIDKE